MVSKLIRTVPLDFFELCDYTAIVPVFNIPASDVTKDYYDQLSHR
jgi:hypothetical protein